MENNYFKATDVKLTGHITIPSEYIEEQFRRFNRYPMRQRFEAMTDYLLGNDEGTILLYGYHRRQESVEERNKKECLQVTMIFKFIKSSLNGLVNPNYSNYGKTEYWNTLTGPFSIFTSGFRWEYYPILCQASFDRRDAGLLSDSIQSYPETISLSENNSWRCLPVCQSLWFVNRRDDQKSIHYGRSNEALQKLPFYI